MVKKNMLKTEKKYFSTDNIAANRFDAPLALAEQAVHCLELVAELAGTSLSFQFKGGNSLLLILEDPKRFSIDVDIATDESRERIETCLTQAISEYGIFSKWTKRQHKTKPWLPLSSYYCFFKSHYVNDENAFIMLDAQLTRSPYATRFAPISCKALYRSETKAEIPFPASIIGDKLLTLGPRTLGIPTGKGKEAQRLKHVFDVSLLLSTMPRLNDIRKSLFACMEHENKLQEKTLSSAEVLADTVAYCGTVRPFASIPLPDDAMEPGLLENIAGLPAFTEHLFSKNYGWESLQKDMARTAFVMAACMKNVSDDEFEVFLKNLANDPEDYWKKTEKWLSGYLQ
jgi:hypothetical protein